MEQDFSHLLSKINPQLIPGFGVQIVATELFRLTFREQLLLTMVRLGIREREAYQDKDWESYVERVFQRVRGLQLQMVRLDHVFIFLRAFPNRKRYERAGITRDVWLEYHIGVYLSTLASLVDLSVLLVNEVHELGIKYERCKLAEVESNRWIVGTTTATALKDLNKAAKKTIERRNADLHRAERMNLDELIQSPPKDSFIFAQFGKAMNYVLPLHPEAQKDAEQLTVQVTKATVPRLTADAKLVTGKVERLFAALDKVFEDALMQRAPREA